MKNTKTKRTDKTRSGSMQRVVRAQFAILTRDIWGGMLGMHWSKGDTVKIKAKIGGKYHIEKHPRIPSGQCAEGLTIINELVGVPKACLRLRSNNHSTQTR